MQRNVEGMEGLWNIGILADNCGNCGSVAQIAICVYENVGHEHNIAIDRRTIKLKTLNSV